MAVDEAILLAAVRGEDLPTLRLYGWQPPCLSIGYAQPTSDVDFLQLNAIGWDIVRRPTGGRAILHTDELTYAVIGPDSNPTILPLGVDDGSGTFSGDIIISPVSFYGLPLDVVKTGSGTQILTGNNTFKGELLVLPGMRNLLCPLGINKGIIK